MVWDVSQVSVTRLKKEVSEGSPDRWFDGEKWHELKKGDAPCDCQAIATTKPMGYVHPVVFEQEQRGGRPEGKSETTRERYRVLARDYWETVKDYARREGEKMISMKDFVDDRRKGGKYAHWWKELCVSTLERAIKMFPTSESAFE
jgi:hypothetical protein